MKFTAFLSTDRPLVRPIQPRFIARGGRTATSPRHDKSNPDFQLARSEIEEEAASTSDKVLARTAPVPTDTIAYGDTPISVVKANVLRGTPVIGELAFTSHCKRIEHVRTVDLLYHAMQTYLGKSWD